MEYPKKVWVIDVPLPFPFGNAQIRREGPALPPPTLGGSGAKAEPKSKRKGKAASEQSDPAARQHSRWHIAFAYVLGPLYPLLTGWTFGNIVWALLGLAALGACAALVGYRSEFLARVESAGIGILPLLAGVSGILLLGVTAWARALAIAGWRMQQRTPLRLTHPGIITALGLLVPGSGLFLSGHPRRGALAFWMLGPLAVGAVILAHAPWLWRLNQGLSAGRIPRSALELTFLAAALVGLGAAFSWTIQALDGARCVSRQTGRVSHGQAVALALLIAIASLCATFKPVQVGEMLDRFAVALRLEGLRVLPLVMELGASGLDPSEPVYSLRAAELYERLGQRERAQELRQDLDGRWKAYARAAKPAAPVRPGAAFPSATAVPPASSRAGASPLPDAFPGLVWEPQIALPKAAPPTATQPLESGAGGP
jgi:hypothetical protein